MAINKVEFGGRTLIDLTDTTATADKILTGYGAYGKDGVWVDGTAIESSPDGSVYQDAEGYVVLDDGAGTHVEVESLSVTENGTYTAPTGYAYSPVSVNVEPNLITKAVTPTETTTTYKASEELSVICSIPEASSFTTAQGNNKLLATQYFNGNSSSFVVGNTYVVQGLITNTSSSSLNVSIDISGEWTFTGWTSMGGSSFYSNPLLKNVTGSDADLVRNVFLYWDQSYNQYCIGIIFSVNTSSYSGSVKNSTEILFVDNSVSIDGYSEFTVNAMPSGTAGTPTATKGTVSNNSVSVTPSVTNTTGYITGGTKTGTAVTVSASELVSGTYNVTSSGTKDVTNYASASIPAGTAGTPAVSKGTVSNHSITITPSVTNGTGWITGGTKTGTAVTVSASELVNGNLSITENGTGIDVTNYETVSVDVEQGETIPHYTLYWDEETGELLNYATCDMTYQQILDSIPADHFTFVCEVYQSSSDTVPLGASGENEYTGNKLVIKVMTYGGRPAYVITHSADSITAQAWDYNDDNDLYIINDYVYAKSGYYEYDAGIQMPSAVQATPTMAFASATGLVTATATQTSGYVTAGTKSSTYQLPMKSAADMTVSGSYVTAPAGYYSQAFSKAVNIGKVQLKDINTGGNIYIDLYSSTGLLSFDYVASGSYGLSSFSAGYISAAPASGNYSFRASASRQLPVLAATTYTPTTTAQTISSYRWLTGAQTIAGDANLVASNIKSGVSIFSVTGTYSGESITHNVAVYDTEGDPNNYVIYNNTQYHGDDYFESIENDTITIHIATSNSYKVYLRGELVSTSNNYAYAVWDNCAVSFRKDDNGYSVYISESEVPDDYTSGQYIMPSIYEQVVARQGDYLNGNIIVYGDSNLISSNIRSGVSIFGVSGTMEEGIVDPYYPVYKDLAANKTIQSSAIANDYFNSLSIINPGQFGFTLFSGYFTFNNATEIGQYAFASNYTDGKYVNQVATFSFPNVTSIRAGAFLDAGSIAALYFPKCVTVSIGAFQECVASIYELPLCETISVRTFQSCYIQSIALPKCSSIPSSAFYHCDSLSTASFSVCTYIGASAFNACNKLGVIFAPNCTTIGSQAFIYCSSLQSAIFPSCTSMGSSAFCYCTGLTTISFDACTVINASTFYNCSKLYSVSLSACQTISAFAFYNCYSTSFTSIDLPNCTVIGSNAFNNCYNLSSINFSKVTSIGSSAFNRCSNISIVRLSNCSNVGSYAFATCWNLSTIYISSPESGTIGGGAFTNCSALMSVYLTSPYIYSLGFANTFYSTPISVGQSGLTTTLTFDTVTNPLPSLSTVWASAAAIGASFRGYSGSFKATWNLNSTNYEITNAALLLAFCINGVWSESNWTGGATYSVNGHWWNVLTTYAGTKTFNVSTIPANASRVRIGIYNNATMQSTTATISGSATLSTPSIYGSIYVPASLYTSYKAATNWVTYSSRFVSLTDAQIAALPF